MTARKTLKVGITGGIGSGKTTVCKIFETLSVPVYYADERAKYLLKTHPEILKGLQEVLGSKAFDSDGNPNRKAIAGIVFSDKDKLEWLNSLIHPRIAEDWNHWLWERLGKFPYLIKEAALFFESGSYREMDKMICVSAPQSLRIQRVMDRDGATKEEIESRMNNQLSQDLKMALSDYLIINDGSLSLVKQVVSLHLKLKS
ncbi:MAG: dephospho-CoA kinase [Saprospirales bacterium]|nr:MAG: dephospho-CoA kinase [Saprospirales bacterium]